MTTAKLFTLGNSQAVRIPARYRIAAAEVEIFQRAGDLVLRPKRRGGGVRGHPINGRRLVRYGPTCSARNFDSGTLKESSLWSAWKRTFR